ncbi:MAG: tryptophan--tRNA ligase [Alphaproteobacteria bacterium]|nr:tryptophan--tRNA ligase [Alphaproteobacteria bacterium]
MTRRILSGMQPTGSLHLGNYLGALRNWVALQADFECFYCVVDLHAITTPQDPAALREAIHTTAAAYIAAGVDPAKSTLFAQSAVPGHAELAWILSNHTPLGWLDRMTQFKEKKKRNHDQELLGLYSYPVLMAADILVYKATHVPVGEDQKQHLELARDLAGAFNRQYGNEYFPLPEPQILGEATRVMSLRDGTKKMSKSDESDYSRITLTDDADAIALKIKRAKTDPEPLPADLKALEARPEADNLVTIYAALAGVTRTEAMGQFAGQQFSAFKNALTETAVAKIAPITARMRELLADRAELDKMLAKGAEKAGALAEKHIAEVKDIVGLWKPGR